MTSLNQILDSMNEEQPDNEVFVIYDGYPIVEQYNDEVYASIDDRVISGLAVQKSVAGESSSQYVEFRMPRMSDGIDLLTKRIEIVYEIKDGVGGVTQPVNVSYSDKTIKLGWAIPPAAVNKAGTILVGVTAIGTENEKPYVWKTTPTEYKVNAGININSNIPEPDNGWYEQFVGDMDLYVGESRKLLKDMQESTVGGAAAIEALENIRIGADGTEYATPGDAVRGQVAALSEEIVEEKNSIYTDGFSLEEVVKNGSEIIVDKEMKYVSSNLVPITIHHSNRFDYTRMSTIVNSYNSNHTITKEKHGLKVVRSIIPTQAYLMNVFEYTAEFSGDLWFSCDAKAEYVQDLMVKIKVNDVEKESLYGAGHIYACIPVEKNDVLKLLFYTDIGNATTGNTIYYSNIMLQYGNMTNEFAKYISDSDNSSCLTKTLVLDGVNNGRFEEWTTQNTANGKYYYTHAKISDMLTETYPQNDNDIGNWESDFSQSSPIEFQSGAKDGIGFFVNGVMAIYVDSVQLRANLPTYLQSNPITITYKYSKDETKVVDSVKVGDILTSAKKIELSGYGKNETEKYTNYVAFGDSITGMFAYSTSYPEMIEQKDKRITAYNCGFSGSQVTDHTNANYKAFSFNRLVDSVISGDFTMQDNAVGNITSAFYSENLATLKGIDFNTVDYVTLFYGTNDWGSNVLLESFKAVYVESITKLLTKYAHLKIIVISPYWRSITSGKDSNVDANSNGEYLYNFSDSIEELARKNFNIPTINLYWCLGANAITNRYYTQDGTHPTFSTRNTIAEKILHEMK